MIIHVIHVIIQMIYFEIRFLFSVWCWLDMRKIPLDFHGCYGRRHEVPPNVIYPTSWPKIYRIRLAAAHVGSLLQQFEWLMSLSIRNFSYTSYVRLFSLSHIVTCFSINRWTDKEITLIVRIYSIQIRHRTYRESMSKDNRHDGRRRGTGQHRVGPRNNPGMDGRERSGSNSSGSSHGGGKNKNSPLSALKVREKPPSVLGRALELNLV